MMLDQRLEETYFNWMARLAIRNASERNDYIRLLDKLNHLNFHYTIPLDSNRYVDGIDLRYRFGYENGIPSEEIDIFSSYRDCTILEMMVALALKCEESIMYDPEQGVRITDWVIEMLKSLKLYDMTNDNFDEQWIEYRINCLNERDYEPDGEGGLFTIKGCNVDLRKVEIWYQMCWYLNTIL